MTNGTIGAILFCYVVVTLSPIPLLWQLSRNLLRSENSKNPEAKIMGSITLYITLVMVYTATIADVVR